MPQRFQLATSSCLIGMLLVAGSSLVGISGCTSSESSEITTLRQKFVLSTEPEKPLSIEQARTEKGEVAIIGQVDLIDVDPFVEGKAAFAISEAPDPEHGHKSASEASNCPFCRRKALKAPTASVEFRDEQGNPLNIDSRKLFDLKKGQIVVVKGEGNFDEKLNIFTVKPTGLYVRR